MLKILIMMVAISLYANITIENGENFTLDIEENLTILGNIEIDNNATLTSSEDSWINIDGNWENFGSFIASTSTINLYGSNSSYIEGETKFYNFISTKNITLESNKTQEITHSFRLSDAEVNSTNTNSLSTINLATVDFIDTKNLKIKDNKIIGRLYAINPKNSTDDGNTIMWFDKDIDCNNIGSGHEWFDKLLCQDTYISYQTKDNSYESKVFVEKDMDISTTVVDTNDTSEKNRVKLTYTSPADAGMPCSKNVEVILNDDTTVKTGFIGCSDDTTIKNWDTFKDSKVFIKDTISDNSHSVIIVDINLTSKLIIGGNL